MKYIFLPLISLFFIMGCGLMNNPKDDDTAIRVPQNVTVEIPDILKSDTNKTNKKEKSIYSNRWYNQHQSK